MADMQHTEQCLSIADTHWSLLAWHTHGTHSTVSRRDILSALTEDTVSQLFVQVICIGIQGRVLNPTIECMSQVLCIDEATASIDHETDTAIQLTLRQQFVGRTVLTVAHRLSTVVDNSDRVIVMDIGGRLAEFSSPATLLSDRNSLFYALVHGANT